MLTDELPELIATHGRAMRSVLEPPEAVDGLILALTVRRSLRQSKFILDFLSACRDFLRETLEETGLEGTSFKKSCAAMTEGLDTFLGAAADLRESIRKHSGPADRAAQLEDVAHQEAQARDVRRSVAEWLEVVNRPRPFIDPERLKRAEADIDAGRVVRFETFEDLFGDAPGQ